RPPEGTVQRPHPNRTRRGRHRTRGARPGHSASGAGHPRFAARLRPHVRPRRPVEEELIMTDTTAPAPLIADVWPLAPLQAGLLFHAVGDDSALDVYTMQSTYAFPAGVDAAALERACGALLSRHTTLRA